MVQRLRPCSQCRQPRFDPWSWNYILHTARKTRCNQINKLKIFKNKSGRSEVKVTQLCPTLWDSMDCSPPGSSVHGILQARILEWVAISYSRGSSRPRSNPGLPHCRQILYHLSHEGNTAFPMYEHVSIQKDKDVERSKINSWEWSPWKRGGGALRGPESSSKCRTNNEK